MENEIPEQAPAPESSEPAKGYRKQPKKEQKSAPPADKPKKAYTPPKPSITVQKWPALLEAINSGNIDTLRQLIADGVNVNTVREGFSPLMIASTAGQVETARFLLQAGVNVNDTDDDGNTAFHRAASYQSGTAIIELLLESGINVNARNRFKKTALMLAEELGHKDIVRSIQAHLDRAAIDEQEWQAFLNTPEGEPYKRRRQLDLLNRYAEFIWAPPVGLAFAGLLLGALFGAAMLTAFIGLVLGSLGIAAGVHQTRTLTAYFDSLEPLPHLDIHIVRAKRKAREPLPPVQKKKPAEPAFAVPAAPPAAAPPASPVVVAASEKAAPSVPAVTPGSGDAEAADAILVTEEKAAPASSAAVPILEEARAAAPLVAPAPPKPAPEPVKTREPHIDPVLPKPASAASVVVRTPAAPASAAARAGRPKATPAPSGRSFEMPDKRVLIIAAAALLVIALLGTAFMLRRDLERWYFAKQLRSRGFDTSPHAVPEAAEKNDLESIDLFIRAGVSLDAADGKGRTALMIAAEKGRADMLAKLIEKGANVNFTAPAKKGPVSALQAVLSVPDLSEAHLRVLQYLLDHGADVKARDSSGRTALFFAAERGREQVAALLLDHGAEVNATDVRGDFPLLSAACGGHTGVARLLLDRGADVKQTMHDQTPFLCAVEEGHLGTMKLLLERGADVNTQTAGGVTVLTIASGLENLAAVTLLLEKGADPASGYLPAPFLALSGRKVSIRAANSRISAVLRQVAKAAARDGYTITLDAVEDRKVTLRTKDSWNRVLHKLAVNNNLLLLVKDREVVVLSYDPAAVKKTPF
ncbi:MAG: ankyrin repeat domain-containing protein [Nitrospirota bacterium]|nr:ankyrin repeat domain-containing protein [Nitrospirota bacterium]